MSPISATLSVMARLSIKLNNTNQIIQDESDVTVIIDITKSNLDPNDSANELSGR